MSTDTGHIAVPFDATWGLNQPEKLIDWGYRAMHGSIVTAKAIIPAYYSSNNSTAAAIKHSYYASCSTGGRQGLKEVQNHPESFDGIVVGAPGKQALRSLLMIQLLGRQPARMCESHIFTD